MSDDGNSLTGIVIVPDVSDRHLRFVAEGRNTDVPLRIPVTGEDDGKPTRVAVACGADAGDVGTGNLRLAARLLVGLAYLGGDIVLARLRSIDQEVAGDVEQSRPEPEDEGRIEKVGYLFLGALLRGQRTVAWGVRDTMSRSARAAGWALRALDRATGTSLGRPLRRPVERWLRDASQERQLAIIEGRREAQLSRRLAAKAVEALSNDFIDSIVRNPHLMASVQAMLQEQSVALSDSVINRTRRWTIAADDVAETTVRRLLRRGARPMRPLDAAVVDNEGLLSSEAGEDSPGLGNHGG